MDNSNHSPQKKPTATLKQKKQIQQRSGSMQINTSLDRIAYNYSMSSLSFGFATKDFDKANQIINQLKATIPPNLKKSSLKIYQAKELNEVLSQCKNIQNAVFPEITPTILLMRAISHGIQHKYDDALVELKTILDNNPNNNLALFIRYDIYRSIGRYDEALQDCTQLLNKAPMAPRYLLDRAEMFIHQGEIEKAQADIKKAQADIKKARAYRYIDEKMIERLNLAALKAQSLGNNICSQTPVEKLNLYIESSYYDGVTELLKEQISKGQPIVPDLRTLQYCIDENDQEMLELLFKHNSVSIVENDYPKKLLHYCIKKKKDFPLIEMLQANCPTIINSQFENNLSMLDIAASEGNSSAVRSLCQSGASIDMGNHSNALYHSIQGDTQEHADVNSLLVEHSPPTVDCILRYQEEKYRTNPNITQFILNENLNASDIEQLPAHLKKAFYTNDISVECLTALENKGIKLIDLTRINMFIDEKYLGGHLPTIESSPHVSLQASKRSENIYDKELKVIVKLPKLGAFKNKDKQVSLLSLSPSRTNKEYQFIPALKKEALSQTDKVFSVFGYRQRNACLPIVSDNNCRCIVVLTVEEYNNLKISKDCDLAKYYDFLIINPRKKIDSDESVKISMLTERRRIAFNFAKENGLSYLVFMDDNIQEIALTSTAPSSQYGTEYLFDYLKHKMDKTGEPLLSIATHSKQHKTIQPYQLGCKVWIENISQISEALPDECFQALMPYNEHCWGEDYYLQVLLNTIFSNEKKNIAGFKILPIDEIQLIRSSTQKSTNSKSGMRVREYEDGDVLHPSVRETIKTKHPEIYKKIELARFRFNSLVRPIIDNYNKKTEYSKTCDVRKIRQQHLALKACEFYNVNRPLTGSSNDTAISLLTRAIKEGDYSQNNLILLFDNKLYFAERAPSLFIYEIEETPNTQAKYELLKEKIQSQNEAPTSASKKELGLIQTIISPTENRVELKGEFRNKLHALLKNALNEEGGFAVSSKGRNVVLRDYQNKAIQWLANYLENSETTDFTLNMATGTGKTALMYIFALAAYSANPNKNVILVFPSIQLVHQTLEKLFSDFKPLIEYFNIKQEKIFGVCSKHSKELSANDIISQNLIAANDSLRNGGNLYLFCAASLKMFNDFKELDTSEREERQYFLQNTSTIILDESHKLGSLEQSESLSSIPSNTLSFKFSATPKKNSEENCPNNEFQYLRTKAIKEKRLSPLLVDNTLPSNCTDDDIKTCLLHHQHPNGNKLKNHKGIIYTSSIEKANKLAQSIKNAKDLDGSPLFGKDFVHVIHSGDKDSFEDQNEEHKTAVEAFKKRKTGVAIVVKMLTEGYDDENIDYVITNKNFSNPDDLHQSIGRSLRLDKHNPAKVGYALITEKNSITAPQETTCYPDDAEQIKNQQQATVGKIFETINKHRKEQDKLSPPQENISAKKRKQPTKQAGPNKKSNKAVKYLSIASLQNIKPLHKPSQTKSSNTAQNTPAGSNFTPGFFSAPSAVHRPTERKRKVKYLSKESIENIEPRHKSLKTTNKLSSSNAFIAASIEMPSKNDDSLKAQNQGLTSQTQVSAIKPKSYDTKEQHDLQEGKREETPYKNCKTF